jgi:hypothetical protein
MLPCGRYYYDPEGGYVGNPWVKFSFQYIYIYLGWLIHHLDIIDHYLFKFYQILMKKSIEWYEQFFSFVNYLKLKESKKNFEQENKNNE